MLKARLEKVPVAPISIIISISKCYKPMTTHMVNI